jgi:diguanylate cyclase (GGDEF)-like protein
VLDNDKYGHLSGDDVLIKLGKVLDANNEIKAGRLGGEEFFVIHSTSDVIKARNQINKIQAQFVDVTSQYGGVTFSAGTVLWQPGISLEEILKTADFNLYKSKNSGKNKVTI